MHLLTYTPVCRKRKPSITNEKRIRRELTNLREKMEVKYFAFRFPESSVSSCFFCCVGCLWGLYNM